MNLVTFAAAFLGSTAFLLAVVAAVWWLDRYEREPMGLVVAAFLWGAVAAPVAAWLGEAAMVPRGGLLAVSQVQYLVVAPLVEEAAKSAAVLLVILLTDQFDNPTDGLVYGTAAGLGFAVAENGLVMALAGSQASLWPVAVVRTLATSGVHAVATAVVGGFFGIAYLSPRLAKRFGWGLAGWLGGALVHACWNASAVAGTSTERGQSPLLALGALAVAYTGYGLVFASFLAWERRVLRRELGEEVRLGVLPEWVLDVIPSYRRRVRGEWWPGRRERTVIARLMSRLAFRKYAVAHLPPEEASLAGLEVVRLRERVLGILRRQGEGSRDRA